MAVGQEKMDMRDESVVKAVGAFAGGIASTGNVCGIMLGGVALVSCIYSRANLKEKENPRMWSVSRRFIKEFEKLARPCGGINCSDIAGVDWTDKEAVRNYYSDPSGSRQICIKLIGDAAYALGEILEQEQK
ncbi:MAG: C-GCAxxG-C-C family protein [Desulfobulbaceae bacterium]|nr:C-GCAxxG-C-C family protein [Desulfobulbaceae bacterium]